ncbi:MAG TPA: efflux RND transporter periplasmic adaptor subunit [Burkholderiales bacterium]|nr:efflux RND transporter periplasmic adaptor subunit [Burkholderiales bacterium]
MRLRLRGAIAVAAALAAACGGEAPPQAGAVAKGDPFLITAGAPLLQRIKVGSPSEAEVHETLRVPGRVEVDGTRVARVGSPVTGRVIELDAREGDGVKRGQILATLTSTELANTQREYLKAHSMKLVADRAASRAKQLLDADVIGGAELFRREAEAIQAEAEVNAARGQLKVLGMSERAIERLADTRKVDSTSHIVSSIDGTVIDRRVSPGQVVQPADTVFIVADLSSVWVVADVPESVAGSVRAGQTIEVEIPALPDRRIRGALAFVSAIVNPETRTVRVRMDVPNPEREYKPAMLASVLIQGAAQRKRAIPSAAVVREENRDYVFVQTGSETFYLRQVTLGEEYDGLRVVVAGLRPDDRIVVDGAFHLNNERRQRALQQGT